MTTAWEVVAGGTARRDLSGNGNTQLIMGAYYRVTDAVIPVIGFEKSGYTFTFSYDATSSSLRNYNQSRGAYEMSIVKQGFIDKSKAIKCPAVRF